MQASPESKLLVQARLFSLVFGGTNSEKDSWRKLVWRQNGSNVWRSECLAARTGGKFAEKDWRQVRLEKVWRQIQIVGGASSVNFSDSARMHSLSMY